MDSKSSRLVKVAINGGIVETTGAAIPIKTALISKSMRLRAGDRGIILITTLLLMTLLAGFAIATQNRAISQAQVIDRVLEIEEERVALQSVRALALPEVGEALLDKQFNASFRLVHRDQDYSINLRPAERRDWVVFSVK